MARYRGVSGVARECVKRYRGVGGVARQLTRGYRGVSGVARQYYSVTPVASAVIRLYTATGDWDGLTFTNNGYYHGSSDEGFTARLVLDLYDIYGHQIPFEKLTDIENLETFSLAVSTSFMIFAGSGTASDIVFGHSCGNYEVYDFGGADGYFTVTLDNFVNKYIDINWKGSCQRTVTFGDIYVNGEAVPITYTMN